MKLYTEEQVIKLINWEVPTVVSLEELREIVNFDLIPIEIPSDDIIKEAANGNIDGYNGAMWLKYNYIIKNKS